ncbi:MAG: hypothetical protein Q8R98_14690 [Rubrivivax sp.]|nr:hypothetical protein [Rubrivivax sp.]
MNYLTGFTEDSDRDPAIAVQALLTARITADLQTLSRRMVAVNVAAVRAMFPSTADGERLAAAVLAASGAIDTFRRCNPWFDRDLRGGADLVAKLDDAQMAAVHFAATTARAKRRAQAGLSEEAPDAEGEPDAMAAEFNMLPALDFMANGSHVDRRAATCHAEAD